MKGARKRADDGASSGSLEATEGEDLTGDDDADDDDDDGSQSESAAGDNNISMTATLGWRPDWPWAEI